MSIIPLQVEINKQKKILDRKRTKLTEDFIANLDSMGIDQIIKNSDMLIKLEKVKESMDTIPMAYFDKKYCLENGVFDEDDKNETR